MSREYYPNNSGIIDLRARVVRTPANKTKRIFDELSQSSTSPHLKMPRKSSPQGELYEVERWAVPRPESSLGAPPRRSLFTPSRLQDFAAQLDRESKKPYWRCPKPLQRIGESSRTVKTLASEASEEIRTIDVRCVEPKETPVAHTASPQRRHAAKVVKIPRRREIAPGFKPNVFSIDADELQVDQSDAGGSILSDETSLSQFPALKAVKAPEPGFLSASPPPIYTFAAPVLRAPKYPSPPLPRNVLQHPTSSSSDSVGREAPVMKEQAEGISVETEATSTSDSTSKEGITEKGPSPSFTTATTTTAIERSEVAAAVGVKPAGVANFDLGAASSTPAADGGFQFGITSPASVSAPPTTVTMTSTLFGTSPMNGKENVPSTDNAVKITPPPTQPSTLFAFGVAPPTHAPAETGANGIRNGTSSNSSTSIGFGGAALTPTPSSVLSFGSNFPSNASDGNSNASNLALGIPSKNPIEEAVKAGFATNGGGFQFGAPVVSSANSLTPINSTFNFGGTTAPVNGALGVPPPNGLFTFGGAPTSSTAPSFPSTATSFPPPVPSATTLFAFGQNQATQPPLAAPDPFSSLNPFSSNFPGTSTLQPSGTLANVFAQEPSTGGRKMLIPKRKRPNK